MKVVILAGGMPSTLTDEREKLPKPMVKIGEKPILWHIMKNAKEPSTAIRTADCPKCATRPFCSPPKGYRHSG